MEDQPMTFTYGRQGSIQTILPLIWSVLILPISTFLIIFSLLQIIIAGGVSHISYDDIGILFIGIIGLQTVIGSHGSIEFINCFNSLRISKEGLSVRVFVLPFYWKWKKLSWSDVGSIEETAKIDRSLAPIWIIKVRNLSHWHKLLGQRYKVTPCEVIIISSEMENRQKLLERLEEFGLFMIK